MNKLIKKDRSITDIFQEQKFTFSAELIPPRNGDSVDSVFEKATVLAGAGVDFISITKGAGGSLRSGTIPISFVIKEKIGVPIVAHITCMEMNHKEIENYLIDHSYLGITNVLALRGDPPTGVLTEYKAGEDQYQYAYQLIEKITELNEGKYILRKGYDKDSVDYHVGQKLDFTIGAAVYPQPEDGNVERNVGYLIEKINRGATFGITQMIYSPEDFGAFMQLLTKKGYNIPILPGMRVIQKTSQAEFLMRNFKINIPQQYLDILKKENNENEIKEYIIDLSLKFKKAGAQGAHFFVMEEQLLVADIIKELRTQSKGGKSART